MAWYAYCITEQQAFQGTSRARRPFVIPGISGIGGAKVLGYPSGEFAVIVSEYTRNGALDQKAILEHARVVSECFRNTTVLPFRFGTVFDKDDDLRKAVRANRKAFTASVSKLKGKAEMHLKLLVKDGSLMRMMDDVELPIATGGAYLSKLREKAAKQRERLTKARALSVQVQKLLRPLEAEVCCKKVDAGGMLIDIAHLIDHDSVAKYQNRYSSAQQKLKDCQITVSGPWPPYHFMPGKLRSVPNS